MLFQRCYLLYEREKVVNRYIEIWNIHKNFYGERNVEPFFQCERLSSNSFRTFCLYSNDLIISHGKLFGNFARQCQYVWSSNRINAMNSFTYTLYPIPSYVLECYRFEIFSERSLSLICYSNDFHFLNKRPPRFELWPFHWSVEHSAS